MDYNHRFIVRIYLSQNLQKYIITCFGMSDVISTFVRKQPTHMFEGFGAIATPHSQHNLKWIEYQQYHLRFEFRICKSKEYMYMYNI